MKKQLSPGMQLHLLENKKDCLKLAIKFANPKEKKLIERHLEILRKKTQILEKKEFAKIFK